ncbi:hypothetical protein R3P38DRAFT_3575185, partial [Favolaschia claudopus]
CHATNWRDPDKTPLSQIPLEVQLRWASKASIQSNAEAHLECAGSDCKSQTGQRRRANKECIRLYCAPCCRAVGGCAKHTSRAEAEENSPPVGVETSDDPRLFGRALTPGYSQGWFNARTSSLQASRTQVEEQEDLKRNVVDVVIWVKGAPEKPQRFTAMGTAGKLVINNSAMLSKFAQEGFISVLNSSSPPSWVACDSRLPIAITPGCPILLKSPDVESCFNLDLEAPRIMGMVSAAVPTIASSGTNSRDNNDQSHLAVESPSVPHDALARLDRFPYRYTCDMVKGFDIFERERLSDMPAPEAFAIAFPDIKFQYKTFQKHYYIRNLAKKHDILNEVAVFGRSPSGVWVIVVRRVDELRKGPVAPQILNLTQGSLTAGDLDKALDPNTTGPLNTMFVDDTTPHIILSGRLSYFQERDGLLVDFHPPSFPETQEVMVFEDPAWLGSRFLVHMGSFEVPGQPDPLVVAVKHMTVQELETRTVWLEGARDVQQTRVGNECSNPWYYFLSLYLNPTDSHADIDVVPICLITNMESGQISLAQPWYHGARTDMVNFDDTCIYFNETLQALSHFTYEMTNFNSVYVEFEGLFSSTGYRVLDSRTHVAKAEENLHGLDFLGSQGAHAVQAFHASHVCNNYCKELKLGRLV